MVYATSAVAFAVIALNAASTMAYPVTPGDTLEKRDPFSESVSLSETVKRSENLEQRTPYTEFVNIKRGVEPITKGSKPASKDPVGSASSNKDPVGIPKDAASKDPTTSTKDPKGAKRPTPTRSGHLPTRTARLRARPTPCKENERATMRNPNERIIRGGSRSGRGKERSSHQKEASGRKGTSHHKEPVAGAGAKGGVSSPSSASVILPRAPVATSAGSATPAKGDTASVPTAHPKDSKVSGEKEGGASHGKIRTITRKGRDGHRTVYHALPATRTRCYSAKETGLIKSGKKSSERVDGHATVSGSANKHEGPSSKTSADVKLAVRYEELLERYYSEIDELD